MAGAVSRLVPRSNLCTATSAACASTKARRKCNNCSSKVVLTTTLSAQTDRFVHDRLPPRDQWPELRYDLPELRIADQGQPGRAPARWRRARGWADRPLLRSPQITFTYAETRERVDRIANYLVHELEAGARQPRMLRGGNSIGMALSWLAVVKAGLDRGGHHAVAARHRVEQGDRQGFQLLISEYI